jgi:hypothetical protein
VCGGSNVVQHIQQVIDRVSQGFRTRDRLQTALLEFAASPASVIVRYVEAYKSSFTRTGRHDSESLKLLVCTIYRLGVEAQVDCELSYGWEPLAGFYRTADYLEPNLIDDLARERLRGAGVENGSQFGGESG